MAFLDLTRITETLLNIHDKFMTAAASSTILLVSPGEKARLVGALQACVHWIPGGVRCAIAGLVSHAEL